MERRRRGTRSCGARKNRLAAGGPREIGPAASDAREAGPVAAVRRSPETTSVAQQVQVWGRAGGVSERQEDVSTRWWDPRWGYVGT
jgi:hypothetical protein